MNSEWVLQVDAGNTANGCRKQRDGTELAPHNGCDFSAMSLGRLALIAAVFNVKRSNAAEISFWPGFRGYAGHCHINTLRCITTKKLQVTCATVQ